MRHTSMKSAQGGGTLICHSKPAESECAVRGGRELLLAPSPPPLPVSPPDPHHPFWHLHVLFMPSIFRIIPNLIAVSLLLPAAAAPKIKSRPRKGMLGWSFLIDQMFCCSKNSGHKVPSEAEKIQETSRCWISNMITLIGQQEHLYIYIFEKLPKSGLATLMVT